MSNPYDPDALATPGGRLQPRRRGVTITVAPAAKTAPLARTPGAPPTPASLHPVQPQPARTGPIGTDPIPPLATVRPTRPAATQQSSGTATLHPVQPQPSIPTTLPNGGGVGAPSPPIYHGLNRVDPGNPSLDTVATVRHPSGNYLSPGRSSGNPIDESLKRLRDAVHDFLSATHGKDGDIGDTLVGIRDFFAPGEAMKTAALRAGIPPLRDSGGYLDDW